METNREERREEIREERREERHEERTEERLPNQEAQKILANGKNHHNNNTRKINRMWLWLGVLILVFILIYFLFFIGTAEDVDGVQNGTQGSVDMIMNFLRL